MAGVDLPAAVAGSRHIAGLGGFGGRAPSGRANPGLAAIKRAVPSGGLARHPIAPRTRPTLTRRNLPSPGRMRAGAGLPGRRLLGGARVGRESRSDRRPVVSHRARSRRGTRTGRPTRTHRRTRTVGSPSNGPDLRIGRGTWTLRRARSSGGARRSRRPRRRRERRVVVGRVVGAGCASAALARLRLAGHRAGADSRAFLLGAAQVVEPAGLLAGHLDGLDGLRPTATEQAAAAACLFALVGVLVGPLGTAPAHG